MNSFNVAKTLHNIGINKLKPMQIEAQKIILNKENLFLLSPTGSGKTLAFLIPMIQQLDEKIPTVQAVILSPSRELAIQTESVFKQLKTGFKSNCCYGGHAMRIEKNNLLHPPAVLIGTPGRIADHIRNDRIDVRAIKFLILDEFDKSLEFGFKKDMEYIMDSLFCLNQKCLVSATEIDELPPFVQMNNSKTLNYLAEKKEQKISLKIVDNLSGEEKVDSLIRLLPELSKEKVIIFFNHQDAVNRISLLLKEKGIKHTSFHGGLKQDNRERELTKLRNGSTNILLATDLAARGIDIPEIKNIVHYQLPQKEDAFIHRNGRTARMNQEGSVFLLHDDNGLREFVPPNLERIQPPEYKGNIENTEWTTLYIDLGKKNKISKMDIVGVFCKKGGLQKDEIGLIEVKDFSCFVAVKSFKLDELLSTLRDEKIKNKKLRIRVAD
ncbi:DEAD/DEAH box helicase [Flavobacteriales bacterium]|nr:DEAD/DEAH box helicase [Flavobacteriales bacterium]